MRSRSSKILVGDFETTVYDNQTTTEVWASALVELHTEDVLIFGSIEATFDYLKAVPDNLIIYYHNLKFDGSFWLDFLLRKTNLKQAYTLIPSNDFKCVWDEEKDMPNNSFKYCISAMGQWYNLIIKINHKYIEIRDSVKLLPFSVKSIGDSFGTKHKKLTMEYEGERYANCYISPEEKEYIKNDVLVVKEALEIMFDEGHKSLTIGSCCLKEFKQLTGSYDYKLFYPDLYQEKLDEELYGSPNIGEYIRKSYHGGWCYLVEGKENQVKKNGITLDVNSLYPSMMSSESGNYYPTGIPQFWKGNYIPDKALQPNKYFFIRIKCRFYIKDGYLPFIQLKRDARYDPTEMLKTSDIKWNGQYYRYTKDKEGNLHDTIQTLTLTMTDYYLILKHYELVDFEILDGCWFYSQIGLFDFYINKYKIQKMNNTGALRELAKLFLNNLYGKLASNTDSSFKVAYIREDGALSFHIVTENNKKAGYIPIGSAITSYARCFTITAAQQNYHGVDKEGFIYADTDSIHCDTSLDNITGVTIHDKNFCCWKAEASWDEAIFTRQKTYIEHITEKNLKPIDKPYYDIKCAGMPAKCKKLFDLSMQGYEKARENEKEKEYIEKLNEEEQEFIKNKRSLEDFKIGLVVPSKLVAKRIVGGIVLKNTPYELRE